MVEITYAPEFYPKYDDLIERKLGSAHGYGMGGPGMGIERDLCWTFLQDKEKAEKFLKRAKTKLRGLKLKINLVKYDSKDWRK